MKNNSGQQKKEKNHFRKKVRKTLPVKKYETESLLVNKKRNNITSGKIFKITSGKKNKNEK